MNSDLVYKLVRKPFPDDQACAFFWRENRIMEEIRMKSFVFPGTSRKSLSKEARMPANTLLDDRVTVINWLDYHYKWD